MIERNGRNGRSFRRIDDICRVKSAAKTDLEHDKIAVSLREPIERERGDELELRDGIACGFKLVRNGRHALYFFDELRLGDHFAVDAKALAKIEHIRGRVEARAVACRRKHARDKRAGGALAIRAGYMDKTRLLLRIAELFAERFNALQPRLDAEAQPGIDLLQCFFVGHY